MSTSSVTRSTSSRSTVVVALGSNLGDRRYNVLRAIDALGEVMRVVRVSAIVETAALDAPAGSPPFLNAVVTGYTSMDPLAMMNALLAMETRLGRAPRRTRNEPRVIDLDLILHGATRMRSHALTLPHPRAVAREFVMGPMRQVSAAAAAYVARNAR